MGHGAKRIVVVLDTSASMKATDVSPSRFARAQREALGVVGRLGAGAEVMVIEAAVQPRVLAPFTHERDQTLAAIRGAHATDLPNRLGEAVRTARALVGPHDFASFCRRPQRGGTERTLGRLTVAATGDRIEIGARAESFLHQMVRALVGTLVAAGEGRIDPADVPAILAARDRAAAPQIAPPQGRSIPISCCITLVVVAIFRPAIGPSRGSHSAHSASCAA
jgi:hypothetical protein